MSLSNAMGATGGPPEEIVICRDREDLGDQAARSFVRLAQEAVSLRGRFSAALAGGATPRALYRSLVSAAFAEKISWKSVHLFWGDERAVPPGHPDSNYHLANETLISHVPIPPQNVHRMRGERSDLQAAADEYEKTLHDFFGPSDPGWPSFDLVLLGIGSDGHTASLFPGSPVLKETVRWVAAPYVEKLNAVRLTLTLPALNHARRVIFLAAGKEKRSIIRDVLSDDSPSTDLPARMVQPRKGARLFFLDQDAAALLGKDLR
ncbi:6-phosphogluconolactonase [Candidatus Manganitrophus noduliformans]|nr:6-phosphogluconolactonase [Candidatus Manganitrophus noduliformans]